ncbi:MFS transporter [Gracilibacillus sp. Marseille-QA3620]
MNLALSAEKKERLAQRNILLFVIGKFISLSGASIYSFVIGLYILKVTGLGTSFALALVCASLPRILFGPIAGTIADKVNRKMIIIVSEVTSGLLMVFILIYGHFFGLPLVLLYLSEAILAITSTFFSVTASSTLASMAGEHNIQKAGSLNQSASSLAGIVGPLIAGILYAFLPIDLIVLLTAITFFGAGIIEYFIKFNLFENKSAPVQKERFLHSLAGGLRYLKENSLLFSLLKMAFWINFFFAGINVAIPYILNTTLNFSSQAYGTTAAMVSVGALVSSLIISKQKEHNQKIRMIRNGFLLLSLLVILIGIPPMLGSDSSMFNISYYLILLGLIGASIMIINIPIMVLIQRTTPNEMRGRIFGLVETISAAIAPLGMILFGLLLDYIPSFYVPYITGGAFLFIAVFSLSKLSEPAEAKLAG